MNNQDFERIQQAAPAEEPARQNYFINQARQIFKSRFEAEAASGKAEERYGAELLQN